LRIDKTKRFKQTTCVYAQLRFKQTNGYRTHGTLFSVKLEKSLKISKI